MTSMNISPEIIGLIDEIKNDRTHGASQLARQAVEVLKLAAERSQADSAEQFLGELGEVGEKLKAARPAMAPIFNIASRFLGALSRLSPDEGLDIVKSLAIFQAAELISDSLQAIAQIMNYSSELIGDGDRIMTHSYSSTVVAALKEAFDRGKHVEVIATRSGPGGTGQRIAQELERHGLTVTLIDDAAMVLHISGVNKVIVGADRICADGNIVNGIGTHQLALAAEKVGVPFYVLCETLKFDPRLKSNEVDLEEKESSGVKKPYFDITPLGLVAGVVTENGLLTPEEVISYIEKLLSA
jgi:eIF-2B alpha/beta/delta-like uncharacterized protein